VEFVDFGSSENSERKCILKILVVTVAPKEASSISITDIFETKLHDPMLLDSTTSQAALISIPSGTVNQEEKTSLNTLPTPTDESYVCHSKRIAIINAGYKNVAAKEKAENKELIHLKRIYNF
jgi:hypothetical protein